MARSPSRNLLSPSLLYRIEPADLHAHLYRVTLHIAAPSAGQLLQLPAWIPGSYLIREFAKNLQGLSAHQTGRKLGVVQLDKATWQVNCAPDQPLEVRYEVYAFDNSVRTAWLDSTRGFFNGTSLCLMVQGQQDQPHHLELLDNTQVQHWHAVTGLEVERTDARGYGLYSAANYDDLVDCPVEMGDFWSGAFTARGIAHRFVVAGAPPTFDGAQLLKDTQAICEAEIDFWHGTQQKGKNNAPPIKNYTFMLNAVHDGYGGLEHRNSTALICNRRDLPRQPRKLLGPVTHKQPEGYTTLLGLISHEYFHTWNVKRLRPSELARYDYSQENYTQLLWFFEGFTSYYDDIFLCRAQRIDAPAYLKLLAKTINQVQQTPGRKVQSVAQASFDAWVKYYRQDENTANATVSYYTKGSLVALCLDLQLRSEGKTTLDAVMQALWKRCDAGPMTEADLLAVLHDLSGRSYAKEIAQWVHSTHDLPCEKLLEAHGVQVLHDPDAVAQQLGLRVKESGGLFISQVLRGGVAEKAGFAAGDEWLAVETTGRTSSGIWRMQSLDDLVLYCGNSAKVRALVSRDKQLLWLTLSLPKPSHSVRLSVKAADKVKAWLGA
jgi:predicted metalloprotease with PDZ domain